MNNAIAKGTWNQLKGGVKQAFGKLTDDDMLQIEGSLDRAVGILQARYGYTQERAQQEWSTFVQQSKNTLNNSLAAIDSW